jgi:hypothetical protein
LPAGTYSGNPNNPDSFTVENKGGFRGARGPSSFILNLRAGYRFPLRRGHSLQAHFDVFNVDELRELQHADEHHWNRHERGSSRPATFLIYRSVTAPTRTAQFNLKYTF